MVVVGVLVRLHRHLVFFAGMKETFLDAFCVSKIRMYGLCLDSTLKDDYTSVGKVGLAAIGESFVIAMKS